MCYCLIRDWEEPFTSDASSRMLARWLSQSPEADYVRLVSYWMSRDVRDPDIST